MKKKLFLRRSEYQADSDSMLTSIILFLPSESSSFEALQVEVASLHSKVTQLTRQNKLLEGELSTVRVQLEARTKALEDVHGELEQAQRQLKGDGAEDRRQEKIEILTAQVGILLRWIYCSGGYTAQVGILLRWIYCSGGYTAQVGILGYTAQVDILLRWVYCSGGYTAQVGIPTVILSIFDRWV